MTEIVSQVDTLLDVYYVCEHATSNTSAFQAEEEENAIKAIGRQPPAPTAKEKPTRSQFDKNQTSTSVINNWLVILLTPAAEKQHLQQKWRLYTLKTRQKPIENPLTPKGQVCALYLQKQMFKILFWEHKALPNFFQVHFYQMDPYSERKQ